MTLKVAILVILSSLSLSLENPQDIDEKLKKIHENPISAIEELEIKGDDLSVKILMHIIENRYEDWKIKIKAIQSISKIKNPIAIDLLIKVLNDPFFTFDCPTLKWHAAKALGNFQGYSKIEKALINSLSDDTIYVREASIESLGKLRSKEAINYIIPFLYDKNFALRISAVKAFGMIGDKSIIPFLKEALDKESEILIKDEFIRVLRSLGVEFDI